MLGFGTRTKTSTYGAIIDVGSGSVGVGILKSDTREKLPEIIYVHRVYMRPAEDPTNTKDRLRKMREALFSATLLLSKDGMQTLHDHNPKARIKRILVTCSSPWAHTISRNIEFKKEHEFKITRSLISELVKSAEEEIISHINESDIAGSLGLVIERATVNFRVNDYLINDPAGLKGTSLKLSHITGLVPEEVLSATYEVRDKILTGAELSAHTYMLVVYCVLRDLFPHTHSLSIVDVTGESTEIGIVEDGILTETTSMPYGSNTLVRDVSSKTGGSTEDVLSYLKALGEQALHDAESTKSKGHLTQYKKHLAEMLEELRTQRPLPQTMVITALPQLEPLFRSVIPEVAHHITNSDYTILEMQKGILNEIATKNNSDVFITIASRFFHKLHGCGEIDTV